MKIAKKQVRIIKKIREASGVWRFISLQRVGARYIWDDRHGYYFLDWREGRKRKREYAGGTPAEATEAQRRKRNELLGALLSQGKTAPTAENESLSTIARAREMFLDHVRAHSPDKPETVRRYEQVLGHFERILGHKKYVESIDRSDIDTYKIKRSAEKSLRHDRPITPRTINFEVSTMRTFFYYLENERGLNLKNPCAKFKHLKDQKKKAKSKPPVYSQEQIDRIFAQCSDIDKTILATLLLTGLRKRELYFLSWSDLDLDRGVLRVTGDNKEGFSPKDYEERVIPAPADLVGLLKKLPRKSQWVFCNANGGRISHLLRRLKSIADRAGVPDATLHKFRHYAEPRTMPTRIAATASANGMRSDYSA